MKKRLSKNVPFSIIFYPDLYIFASKLVTIFWTSLGGAKYAVK